LEPYSALVAISRIGACTALVESVSPGAHLSGSNSCYYSARSGTFRGLDFPSPYQTRVRIFFESGEVTGQYETRAALYAGLCCLRCCFAAGDVAGVLLSAFKGCSSFVDDFNGDGNPDRLCPILSPLLNGTLSLGNGNGTFTPGPSVWWPTSTAIANSTSP